MLRLQFRRRPIVLKPLNAILFLFAALSVSCPGIAKEEQELWSASSPDKAFFAAARQIPDQNLIYRRDLDGFLVVIYVEGRDNPPEVFAGQEFHGVVDIYARREFPERSVSHIAWSPDSKFLLFTTASSGGHSPWHFKTFAFCVADKSFRDVESVTGGNVIAPEFSFDPPDLAILTAMDTAHPESDAGKQVKVPLARKSVEMSSLN